VPRRGRGWRVRKSRAAPTASTAIASPLRRKEGNRERKGVRKEGTRERRKGGEGSRRGRTMKGKRWCVLYSTVGELQKNRVLTPYLVVREVNEGDGEAGGGTTSVLYCILHAVYCIMYTYSALGQL